jgi:hypothetical protein
MTSQTNASPNAHPEDVLYLFSIGFLLVHLYVYCFLLLPLPPSGLVTKTAVDFYLKLEHVPIIDHAKLMIFAIQLIIVLCETPRFNYKKGWGHAFTTFAWGCILFFGSDLLADKGISGLPYLILTVAGYFLLIRGMITLNAALRDPFHGLFAKKKTDPGFQQTERFIETTHSLHLRGTYRLNGRRRKTVINLINPRRGILIMGTPGSGKSRFIIEPLIRQLIEKGTALFIYDIKYPELSCFAYGHFLANKDKYPAQTRFSCINFLDLSRSHRCNLIDPATIEYASDAIGISRSLLNSINKTWEGRQGEFFVDSPVSFLAALIWFLRNYADGRYCTLPHVVELSKTPYEELFTILYAAPATRGLVGKFVETFRNKTMETLDGQIGSARIPLDLLDSPDFYYILSGNNMDLEINHPQFPSICCLAANFRRREALAPVMSLLVDRLNRQINDAGRYPSALVLDEFATIRATSVLNTIATGRSHNISVIISVQDVTQLYTTYSHAEANQVMNTPGNLICGQVTGETARWVKERFDSVIEYRTTVSINSSDTSVSQSEQSKESITTATLAGMSSGEFAGVIADDPETPLQIKNFHVHLRKDEVDSVKPVQLPVVAPVDRKMLDENAAHIRAEITDLVATETKRIMNDPTLKKYIVKR